MDAARGVVPVPAGEHVERIKTVRVSAYAVNKEFADISPCTLVDSFM